MDLAKYLIPPQRAMILGTMAKKPLQPLIPLEDLKKVLAEIVHAPAEKVEIAKAKTKRQATKKH
jgi:hypothetical protein